MLSEEVERVRSEGGERVRELEGRVRDQAERLSAYQKVESEMDDVVLQAAQGQRLSSSQMSTSILCVCVRVCVQLKVSQTQRRFSSPMDLGPTSPPLPAGEPSRGPSLERERERERERECSLMSGGFQCAVGSEGASIGTRQRGSEEGLGGREISVSAAAGRG